MDNKSHKQFNRLIDEKSPYLLQHATNPVDWYPWGEEAFEKAKKENKPIFLSIGYSTCHWCHVMEKESFEDLEVARLMNETFVSIKVDREEKIIGLDPVAFDWDLDAESFKNITNVKAVCIPSTSFDWLKPKKIKKLGILLAMSLPGLEILWQSML